MYKSSSFKNLGKSIIYPSLNYKKYFKEAIKQYDIEEKKFLKNKSCSNIFMLNETNSTSFQSRNYIPSFDPEKFNINKKIKEIQEQTKRNNILDIIYKNKSYFSKENIEIVAESSKLLKNIKKKKNDNYNKEDYSLSKFLSENKEISIKNLLIKLLKFESEKLIKIEETKGKEIEIEKKNYLNELHFFIDYINQQKKACKEIENILSEMQKKNKILFEQQKNHKIQIKIIEDDMERYLESIDNLRICALFVNRVLEKDCSKFQKKILPINQKINIENKISEYTDSTINNYNFVLEDNFNDNSILNEESNFFKKYNELQHKILNQMNIKEEINNEIRKIQIKKDNFIKENEKRYLIHKKEEKKLIEEYERILIEYNNLNPLNVEQQFEVSLLIKSLNNEILQNDLTNSSIRKQMKTTDFAKESIEQLKLIEMRLNNLIEQMEIYEKENFNLFNLITSQRKNEIKEIKQQIAKVKLEKIIVQKKIIAQRRLSRYVVKSRKTEAPFQIIKKVKKESIDTETIRKEEDSQLLNY